MMTWFTQTSHRTPGGRSRLRSSFVPMSVPSVTVALDRVDQVVNEEVDARPVLRLDHLAPRRRSGAGSSDHPGLPGPATASCQPDSSRRCCHGQHRSGSQ